MARSAQSGHLFLAGMIAVSLSSCDAQSAAEPPSPSPIGSKSVIAAPENTPASGRPAARADRLPDLVMLPLEAFHVAYEGKRKVLRFSADVANSGDGPLDVTGVRATTQEANLRITQRILKTDGSQRAVKTEAVMRYELLDGHDHFHVQDFERYRLRPEGEEAWRESRKEGFCLRDDGNLSGKPSRYPDADFDCGQDMADEALLVRQGLSEGWVDVYDWYLEGQFIDLEGLQLPGNFCVEAEADPEKLLTEITRDNNVTSTLVRISESQVSVVRDGC